MLYLFDDRRARRWSPFAESRPVGELRFGARLLRERVELLAGEACVGHLCGSRLVGWDEPDAPPAVDVSAIGAGESRTFWLSRAVPEVWPETAGDARTFQLGDAVVGWSLPPGVDSPSEEMLQAPNDHAIGEVVQVDATLLAWPWSLVQEATARLTADLTALHHPSCDPGELPGVHRLGSHPLHLEPGAAVEPGVILDLRDGPIRLERDTTIQGHARIVGPVHLGEQSIVFGGSVASTAIGPLCKVRGEIADSVLLGYTNKAHDGYLGHALVGRWVNMGAGTTNSDLKNSYGNVRVELPHGRFDTNLMKVGVFLGDHVKTGIGTLLTTGGVVGAGTNVFGGGGAAPRHLPPFTWCASNGLEPFLFGKFLEIAQAAMARRGHSLSPGVEGVMRRLWGSVHGER